MSLLKNLLILSLTFFVLVKSFAKETDSFIVVNKLAIAVDVSKLKILNFFPFALWNNNSDFEVIQKVLLGTGDCVTISSEDVAKVRIRSEFLYRIMGSDVSNYINVCSPGKCKAQNSKISFKENSYEGEQMPLQSLPRHRCAILDPYKRR